MFKGENEAPREVTDEDRARAQRAYALLHAWDRVPGLIEIEPAGPKSEGDIAFRKGTVDEAQLSLWFENVRKLAEENDRLGVCDSILGQMLAHSPADHDGSWPCTPVRNLIERVASEDLDHGLEIGVYNKRGVHFRERGGNQERTLSAKLQGFAKLVRAWPRTFALLTRLAEGYEREGRREDERAAFEEFEE